MSEWLLDDPAGDYRLDPGTVGTCRNGRRRELAISYAFVAWRSTTQHLPDTAECQQCFQSPSCLGWTSLGGEERKLGCHAHPEWALTIERSVNVKKHGAERPSAGRECRTYLQVLVMTEDR